MKRILIAILILLMCTYISNAQKQVVISPDSATIFHNCELLKIVPSRVEGFGKKIAKNCVKYTFIYKIENGDSLVVNQFYGRTRSSFKVDSNYLRETGNWYDSLYPKSVKYQVMLSPQRMSRYMNELDLSMPGKNYRCMFHIVNYEHFIWKGGYIPIKKGNCKNVNFPILNMGDVNGVVVCSVTIPEGKNIYPSGTFKDD